MQRPYAKEAEQAYLGSIMIDPSVLVSHPIDVDDLYLDRHREIYTAMKSTYAEHGTVDLVLLSPYEVELYHMMSVVVSALHAKGYAKEISKTAERREMLDIASEIANDVATGSVEAGKYIDKITKAIRVDGNTSDLSGVADTFLKYVQERSENPTNIWGVATPWLDFNNVTGGLHRHTSNLFYGPSGVGKTILVLQMGYHAATLGYNVDFYELEMTSRNLFGRLVAMHSKIPTRSIHEGKAYNKFELKQSIDYVKSLPIKISDATHWTSSEIRADQQKNRADVVIVDYLALLNDKAENDYVKVERAAKNLRQMAKDLGQILLLVSSEVKDGSIKGTAEVKFAQDEVWNIKAKDPDNKLDRVRILSPMKRREDGTLFDVDLVMTEGLPMFEDAPWK